MGGARLEEDALHRFEERLDTEEYRHVALNRAKILAAYRERLGEVVSELRPAASNLGVALEWEKSALAARPLTWDIALELVAGVAAFVLALLIIPAWSAAGLVERGAVFAGPLLFLHGGIRLVAAVGSARRVRQAGAADVAERRNAYEAELDRVTDETIRRTFNDVYAGTGKLPFPTFTPALVELSASVVVPVAPLRYVAHFVRSHTTSAVGVAGLRGAGKSSLLRALCARPAEKQTSVCVSAPVEYDPLDFSRRLVLEATKKLLEAEGVDISAYEPPRKRRSPPLRATMVLAIAALIAAFGVSVEWLYETRVDIAGLALVGFVLTAFVVYVSTSVARVTRRGPTGRFAGRPPYVRLAADLYEALEWEREQTATTKTVISLGSWLGGEDEGSVLRRRRPRSHPDLVAAFADVLTKYSEAREPRPLVIAVDELDKIGDTDKLVAAVNGMKDLFHMPNVHFLVSVSTDALARFTQRGLPVRDAFDSAFDTIVEVGPPTVQESVNVVHERAVGFPRPLTIFCHAWAGALPRDLLRAARACVELQRKAPAELPAAELVTEVVTSDLADVARARLSSGDVDEGEAEALLDLVDLTNRLRNGEVGEQDALSEARVLEAKHPRLDRITTLTQVALATLFFFKRAVLWVTEEQELEHDVVEVAEVIAGAVAAIPLPAPARERALAAALHATGLRQR